MHSCTSVLFPLIAVFMICSHVFKVLPSFRFHGGNKSISIIKTGDSFVNKVLPAGAVAMPGIMI
jgi:hypothetical protein